MNSTDNHWQMNGQPLPKDPVMLLSVINTALRDHYASLDALIEDNELDLNMLLEKLAFIDYEYDPTHNQFR